MLTNSNIYISIIYVKFQTNVFNAKSCLFMRTKSCPQKKDITNDQQEKKTQKHQNQQSILKHDEK